MEMKSKLSIILGLAIGLFLVLLAWGRSQAEASELRLRLSKDFGYQAGGTIQGSFTLTASGPEDLSRVVFIIDGNVMGVDDEAPFQWEFSTSEYDLGDHEIFARGMTSSGLELTTAGRRLHFISPEMVLQEVMKILIPISATLVLITVAGLCITIYAGREKKRRDVGDYGMAGGAICRGCGLPFSRNMLSLNLLVGKLEKCPHCGNWSIVGRATRSELADAEQRFLRESQEGQLKFEDESDRLYRLIEESRFEN